jgi:hypothetical protein
VPVILTIHGDCFALDGQCARGKCLRIRLLAEFVVIASQMVQRRSSCPLYGPKKQTINSKEIDQGRTVCSASSSRRGFPCNCILLVSVGISQLEGK